jgi:hypothetical protein
VSEQQQRTKVHSLIGMPVVIYSLDGVRVSSEITVMIVEEISVYGFLFRESSGSLVFASSASFRAYDPSVEGFPTNFRE